MLYSFFPRYKVSYDPQNTNDSEIETIFAESDTFNKSLINTTVLPNDIWRMAYESFSEEDNGTYYDAIYFVRLSIYYTISGTADVV